MQDAFCQEKDQSDRVLWLNFLNLHVHMNFTIISENSRTMQQCVTTLNSKHLWKMSVIPCHSAPKPTESAKIKALSGNENSGFRTGKTKILKKRSSKPNQLTSWGNKKHKEWT